MAEAVRTCNVTSGPAVVWDVLADFGNLADWVSEIDHSELTTLETGGVGATRRVQRGRSVLLERVVDWEPGQSLAYEITGLPRIVRRAENRWHLDALGAGTEVTLTSIVDAGGRPPQELVATAVATAMGRVSRMLLAGLAAHLERIDRV